MFRKRLLGAAAIGAVALLLAACGGEGGTSSEDTAGSGGSLNLILGHAGSTTDLRQDAALLFKEKVEEASDGEISIEIHPAAALGTWEDQLQSAQTGNVDFVIEGILSLEAYTELAAIETVPFLYESPEHFNEVWQGDLGASIKETLVEDSGYDPLGMIYRGPRELNTREEVTSLPDLEGKTIRTPSAPTMLATWQALGARSEALPFDEVFSALQQGVIDGQENPLETIYFNSLHEVAPYLTQTSHVYGSYHFITWSSSFESKLSDEQQELVRQAADEASIEISEDSLNEQEELLQNMIDEGVTVSELSDREAWVTAVESVIDGLPDQVQQWVQEIKEAG